MATNIYFGLDLTSSEKKPSACVSIYDEFKIINIAIAAYTGHLYMKSKIVKLGNDSEGFIYLPDNSCGRVING